MNRTYEEWVEKVTDSSADIALADMLADWQADIIRRMKVEHQLRVKANALNKRIAELEAERKWIPVSERLPEVYRDEDGEFIPFLVCENDKGFPYRALYDGLNWGDGMFVADVTHWMPLPTPPEAQE